MENYVKLKRKHYYTKIAIFVAIGLGMVAASITTFIFSYRYMEDMITLEREEYISELTSQVVAKVNATINEKFVETNNYANLINQTNVDTFYEATEIFKSVKSSTGNNKVLFLSDKGSVYLLDGTTIRITDLTFLANISEANSVASAFSPLGTLGDFWLFGNAINHVVIDGIEMVAVINANKNAEFSQQMTVSMFERQTYSFLVDNLANILIKPDNTVGYGSNLINSLTYSGLTQKEANIFLENIKNHTPQSSFFLINGEKWLLQTAYASDVYSVALLLPLQITANSTIKALNQTMILVSILLFISMTCLVFVIVIILKSHNDKRLQQEQFQMQLVTQAAQNKSEFLSKISHDIRTPLNGIIGMTYLGIENLDNRPALEDNLTKIKTSADYLLALLNDVLDMSKINNHKMKLNFEAANVEDILPQVVSCFEIQTTAKKIHVNLSGDYNIPNSYLMDSLRVKQILMNLVSNAVKFTPVNGTINLKFKVMHKNDTTDNVVYSVNDNGSGMSNEFLKRIFTTFEQESLNTAQLHGGSGLGLSIVKSLVELMGGTVSVESHVGKGSTFTVLIPMERIKKHKKTSIIHEVSTNENLLQLVGKKVLLAEDHPINAQIATKILEHFGFEVSVAENGKAALDLFLASSKGCYSIIFMDIQMPIMDGLESTKEIRLSKHPDAKTIPIYAMSANSFEDDIRNSLDAGMNGHIRKPIEIPVIKKVIIDVFKLKEEKL